MYTCPTHVACILQNQPKPTSVRGRGCSVMNDIIPGGNLPKSINIGNKRKTLRLFEESHFHLHACRLQLFAIEFTPTSSVLRLNNETVEEKGTFQYRKLTYF